MEVERVGDRVACCKLIFYSFYVLGVSLGIDLHCLQKGVCIEASDYFFWGVWVSVCILG